MGIESYAVIPVLPTRYAIYYRRLFETATTTCQKCQIATKIGIVSGIVGGQRETGVVVQRVHNDLGQRVALNVMVQWVHRVLLCLVACITTPCRIRRKAYKKEYSGTIYNPLS